MLWSLIKDTKHMICGLAILNRDVTYYKQPEVTNYTLDRNQEYTQVLKANDTINVYGDTLLQSNHESIITAKNESVVAKVTSQDIKKISYHDYGQTSDIKSGNGYNGETLDQTGLIYLRARYYDPSVSRFVQIDNNYDGEKQSIASQNKYVYTMNNPYKYVDRNGNWSLFKAIGNFVDNVVKTVKKVVKKAAKVITSWFKSIVNTVTQVVNKVAKAVTNVFDGSGSNSNSGKSGGSKVSKPPVKKVKVEAKCPEKAKSSSNGALDVLQDVLDWIGWIPGIGDICDGINAVISFLRGMFLACAISVACLALPVIADAIFKPIKKLVSSVGDFAKKAIEGLSKAGHKPSKIINGVVGFCNGVKDFVKGCWVIPSNIKTKVSGWIDSAKNYVVGIFEKAKTALGKSADEAVEVGVKAYANSRPSFRKGVVEKVWEKAKKDGGGKVIDQSGKIIEWTPGQPRNGVWDMGHIPEAKYSKKHKEYMDGLISKEEFVEWYNTPSNYRPELPSTNRGHGYE